MNALLLGEREAAHLGFELVPVRRRLIVVTALVIGPLVAVTGGIGFVGLVVPHLVRMILGAHHRYLLPASVVAGALLLTLARSEEHKSELQSLMRISYAVFCLT